MTLKIILLEFGLKLSSLITTDFVRMNRWTFLKVIYGGLNWFGLIQPLDMVTENALSSNTQLHAERTSEVGQ
jgi:hypothetical protein